jgi:hypothetical protein
MAGMMDLRCPKRILPIALLGLAVLAMPVGPRAAELEWIEGLTPGEQYRQLSLLLLVAGGVGPEFPQLMVSAGGPQSAVLPGSGPGLGLDEFVTPLARIVDPETQLARAAQMFDLAGSRNAEIQQRLREIARANPILISMVDVNEIAADAIIIRNAIADSVEYSPAVDHPDAARLLQDFRAQTIHLRNMMEYNQFQEELAAITDQAIIDLGGRLDAYQRMFDDDVDPDLVRRRVESAEIMNEQTDDRYEEQAMLRNSELLMMLILMESQVR